MNLNLFRIHFSGDILSSILAQQLGLQTVPCVIAAKVSPVAKWKVDVTSLGWKENDTVALIQWVPAAHRSDKVNK